MQSPEEPATKNFVLGLGSIVLGLLVFAYAQRFQQYVLFVLRRDQRWTPEWYARILELYSRFFVEGHAYVLSGRVIGVALFILGIVLLVLKPIPDP